MSYSYSFNEEDFHGSFKSIEEALGDAWEMRDDYHSVCFVGENVAPPDPWDCFNGDDVLELILNNEEYQSEWASGWLDGLPEKATNELTEALSAAVKAWVEKYGLEPSWFSVENITEHKNPMTEKEWEANS